MYIFLHFTSKYNTNNMERVQFKLCSLGEPKVSLPKVSPSVMLENINGESLNLNSFQTVFQFRLFSCRLNFHGDELHPLGGAELGAELGAQVGGSFTLSRGEARPIVSVWRNAGVIMCALISGELLIMHCSEKGAFINRVVQEIL